MNPPPPRPTGRPVLHQTWDALLFLHWPLPPDAVRPLVPVGLELDLWDGTAWVGVTPFTMRGIRLHGLPPVPPFRRTHELNVRTYVRAGGVPGVWFLSLDASNSLAVAGARLLYGLPYHRARMQLTTQANERSFRSVRAGNGGPAAMLEAGWVRGERLPAAAPGTLEHFLIERYCLYCVRRRRLRRAWIRHAPWPLCAARLGGFASSMLESHGLPTPSVAPLLHAQAEPLHVAVWLPERVG